MVENLDLGEAQQVVALQIDHADEGSQATGVSEDPYDLVEAAPDGKRWQPIVDRRTAGYPNPHEYIVLNHPVNARYLRITNAHEPNGAKFSLSGFRIFGTSMDKKPAQAEGVMVVRSAKEPKEKRIAEVSWKPAARAGFYIVRWGIAPDSMTYSAQIYGIEAMLKSVLS